MLGHEPNLVYAPFSGSIALLFGGIGTTAGTVLFYIFWWVHMVIVFTFMVFVPQSKQFHELFAMINIFFKKQGPVGKLRKIDFEDEEAEAFGVGKIEDFTQHQLIDLYACAECGRCTNMCPASGTGKDVISNGLNRENERSFDRKRSSRYFATVHGCLRSVFSIPQATPSLAMAGSSSAGIGSDD